MFSLWTRPTIPFKLQCETDTIKQDIASQISSITYAMSQDRSEIVTDEHF